MSKSISIEKRKKIIIALFAKAIYEGLKIPHENFLNIVNFFLKLDKDKFRKFMEQDYRHLIYFCIQKDNRFLKQAYIPETIERDVYKEDIINELLEKEYLKTISLYLDNLCSLFFDSKMNIHVETDFIECANFKE